MDEQMVLSPAVGRLVLAVMVAVPVVLLVWFVCGYLRHERYMTRMYGKRKGRG